MEKIGNISRRKIYYVSVRNNKDWKVSLPNKDWIAVTIANTEDEELVPSMVKVCIDKNVSYASSLGKLAHLTEEYFDEEVSFRIIDNEINKDISNNYEDVIITTSHQNFSEGFWFASSLTKLPSQELEKVICIDLTKQKVKKHLIKLIHKINGGWLPSDEDIELPKYDN